MQLEGLGGLKLGGRGAETVEELDRAARSQRAKENGVSDVSIVAGLEKKLTQIVNSDNYIKIGNKVTNAMMIEIASDLKLVMLNKDQIYQHNKAISADAKRRAAE